MPPSVWPKIRKRFSEIEAWAKKGLSEKQIFLNLGISKETWYKLKRQHAELVELIDRARIPVILELTNKLYERACGTKRVVKKTYARTDPDGNTTTYLEKVETDEPPNVAAIHLLLKNWNKENWSNDPVHTEIARRNAGIEEDAAQQEMERLTEEDMQEILAMQKQVLLELKQESERK